MVAPMNSEGEKIPPEEPEPRLSRGGATIWPEQNAQKRGHRKAADKNSLDRRVADALDE